jgi:glutamine synthetase
MTELGQYCRDEILKTMGEVRAAADELEALTGSKYWPFPTYSEILFSV